MDSRQELNFIRTAMTAMMWDPYYMTLEETIEKVERCTARWVTGRFHNTSHVTDMLHLGWCDPYERRMDNRLCMIYKIRHGRVDIPNV